MKCRERLDDVFKIKRERWKGFNKYVKEFHKRKERIHRERIDRIQREKINLLKINDVEGYLRMVQVGLFSYYISRHGRIHKYWLVGANIYFQVIVWIIIFQCFYKYLYLDMWSNNLLFTSLEILVFTEKLLLIVIVVYKIKINKNKYIMNTKYFIPIFRKKLI